MNLPRIRIDDVLQSTNFSPAQLAALEVMPFFEWFKYSALMFDGLYVKLAIVAEGIDKNPEWVELIKSQKNWEVQVHCWEHKSMNGLFYEDVYKEIKDAKEKIQDTFHQKVVEFYPPKHKYSNMMMMACDALDLSLMVEKNIPEHYIQSNQITSIYYHFWNPKQIKEIERIINESS